jgi:hypothetical protein
MQLRRTECPREATRTGVTEAWSCGVRMAVSGNGWACWHASTRLSTLNRSRSVRSNARTHSQMMAMPSTVSSACTNATYSVCCTVVSSFKLTPSTAAISGATTSPVATKPPAQPNRPSASVRAFQGTCSSLVSSCRREPRPAAGERTSQPRRYGSTLRKRQLSSSSAQDASKPHVCQSLCCQCFGSAREATNSSAPSVSGGPGGAALPRWSFEGVGCTRRAAAATTAAL